MAAKKKKKPSTNRLLVIVMAVFVGICSFKIAGTQMEISEKEYQLQQLENSIKQQEELNKELENQLEQDQAETLDKVAYEQYGYGYPDEHIFIDSQAS